MDIVGELRMPGLVNHQIHVSPSLEGTCYASQAPLLVNYYSKRTVLEIMRWVVFTAHQKGRRPSGRRSKWWQLLRTPPGFEPSPLEHNSNSISQTEIHHQQRQRTESKKCKMQPSMAEEERGEEGNERYHRVEFNYLGETDSVSVCVPLYQIKSNQSSGIHRTAVPASLPTQDSTT